LNYVLLNTNVNVNKFVLNQKLFKVELK
jgi:hypothetical protein